MKYLIALLSALAIANGLPSYPVHPAIHAPYPVHPGVGSIIKGPSSETIIKGPDGSIITAAAEGGAVAIKGDAVVPVLPAVVPGTLIVPRLAPVVLPSPAIIAKPAPIILQQNPIIVPEIAVIERDPKIVEEHVVVRNRIISVPKAVEENTDLIGPSGTISTRGGDVVISGPASTTIKGGGVVASIEKQSDIPLKTIEVKPVVAPAIINPIPVTPVVASLPSIPLGPIAPIVHAPLPLAPVAPLISGVLNSGPIITEARPLLQRPAYAHDAPIVADPRVAGGIIHPIPHQNHAPLLHPILNHGEIYNPNLLHPNYGYPPLNHGNPIYGGFH